MRALTKLLLLVTCWMAVTAVAAPPKENVRQFRFAAIQQPGSEAALQETLVQVTRRNPEFVVLNGIKSAAEPCTDELYTRRLDAMKLSPKPLVVSLAGSDWIACRSEDGKPNSVERLQRLRELFFEGDTAFGVKKLKLVRQSLIAQYRSFPENVYWQQGKVLFATIHLPAENNNYLTAAGRNSEFEDRLTASRHWLQRVFNLARLHKMRGVVLFADGNPMAPVRGNDTGRDGFQEIRRQLVQLASRFPGRVLLVHGRATRSAAQIAWSGNVGTVSAGTDGLDIIANPSASQVFAVARKRTDKPKK